MRHVVDTGGVVDHDAAEHDCEREEVRVVCAAAFLGISQAFSVQQQEKL